MKKARVVVEITVCYREVNGVGGYYLFDDVKNLMRQTALSQSALRKIAILRAASDENGRANIKGVGECYNGSNYKIKIRQTQFVRENFRKKLTCK